MKHLSSIFICLLVAITMQAGTHTADSLLQVFHQYYSQMDVENSIKTLNQIIEISHREHNTENEAKARWNIIATYNNAAKYDSLLVAAKKQREWFGKQKIWNRYYQCWQRICSAYHDTGRMQAALREARDMREDAQQRNNNTGRAMAYKQMAIIYYDIRQLEPATKAFQQSINLLKKEENNEEYLNGVYDGLCQTLNRRKLYREEKTIAEEWKQHLQKLLNARSIETVGPSFVTCYLAFCAAYIGMEDYSNADKAMQAAQNYQNIVNSTLSALDIAVMETRLSLTKNQPEEAIVHAKEAYALGIEKDRAIDELYAEALLRCGQNKEAAVKYRNLYEEKDSIFTRDMRIQLDELNTLFQIDELEKKQQQTRNNYFIIVAIIVIGFLLFYGFVRYRNSKKLKRKNLILAKKNEELEKANKKAEESLKMRSEFIKNISHEIRTPLNILNGFTQILLTPDMKLDQQEKKDIRKRVEENTQRITELANKMLELTESNSITEISRTDTVSALQIAEIACNNTEIGSDSHLPIKIEIESSDSHIMLTTNEEYAERAMTLLLFNAKKFRKPETPISEHHVSIHISTDPVQKIVSFAVEDNGIGVPAEEAERIFEEFVQLNDYYEGTGIGLTVARSLVKRLGGDITLDSTYTNGARFIMTLPL